MSAELRTWYEPIHAHAHHFSAAKKDFEGSDPIMQELAKAIHDGRLAEGWIDPALMQWTADQLMQGLSEGFSIGDDETAQSQQLQEFMRRNVFVFSGLKTQQTLQRASNALLDDDGQFVTFDAFKGKMRDLDQEYNKRYLKAEYQHALASAQMAERWTEIERDKELFPSLRFDTAGDDRVRPGHARLDGIVRLVGDAFWDTYYPPLDWMCRCDVVQTRDVVSGKLPEVMPTVPKMFANNVGKTGVVFPTSHPCYKTSKAILKAAEKAVEQLMTPSKTTPNGPAVSKLIKVMVEGDEAKHAKRMLKVIDSVHRVHAEAPNIPVRPWQKGVGWGMFSDSLNPGLAVYVEWMDEHYLTHFVHEMGHYMDMVIPATRARLASMDDTSVLGPVMKAIDHSATVKRMRAATDHFDAVPLMDAKGKAVKLLGAEEDCIEYWLQPEELWARAYNQYIAVKSGDSELLRHTFGWRERRRIYTVAPQWITEEFLPILKAIDKAFLELQWITKAK